MKHLRTFQCIKDVASSGSIRKSAERLSLTPSALTRKIQSFEAELGTQLFERVPHGMRLNAAGELLLFHIQAQMSDFDRLRSQIADLSGVRRGHVTIATSQAFAHSLIPREIAAYRSKHPLVSFSVVVRDHVHAVNAVAAFEADVALVIAPPPAPEFQPLEIIHQPMCCFMNKDHPLAAEETVRLRECLKYPIAMPGPSLAIRHHVQGAIVRASLPVNTVVESDSFEVLRSCVIDDDQVISFQIRAGIPKGSSDLIAREIDQRDMPPTHFVLGQLRGRSLSVAASKFVDQISGNLNADYGS